MQEPTPVGDFTHTDMACHWPTGWAPTRATKSIAHGVGSYNKGIAQRQTKKGPLVAALFLVFS
jgi:hypothetical protein